MPRSTHSEGYRGLPHTKPRFRRIALSGLSSCQMTKVRELRNGYFSRSRAMAVMAVTPDSMAGA